MDTRNIYSNFINPLLNDSNSILSTYLYWKTKSDDNQKYFLEFNFDKTKFNENFTFVAGIDEIINLLENFKFNLEDISFLKNNPAFSYLEDEFFNYLLELKLDDVQLYGYDNGDIVTKENLCLSLQGPITKLQLLKFPISNLLSFSSLICTNSARMKIASKGEDNKNMILLEFGLRRAQGPMGGLFASKYSNLIFDAASNVLSGFYYNLPVKGTCAHAYIMSYQGELYKNKEKMKENCKKLFEKCLEIRERLKWTHTNLNELFAFASFAWVYKDSSNLLVDTYDTINSGVKNSIIVGIAMSELTGNKISGVRLDSGDIAELSKKSRELIDTISEQIKLKEIKDIKISASNDINENSISQFNKKKHKIDVYGIGTNLVTCQLQPYLQIQNKIEKDNHLKDKLLFCNGASYNEKNFINWKIKALNNLVNLKL
jgi:nicotinate phosphoribosyltransferase